MSIANAPSMTFEEFLALPDDGVDRELIRGQLREYPGDHAVIMRNHWHAGIEATIAQHLKNWLDEQPEPRGKIVSGEAGFRLARDPETCVGIDVAYATAEQLAAIPTGSPYLEGPPVLAVEILSPSSTEERTDEKIAAYLAAGVAIVWLVDPTLKTVTVLRPDAEPELFNVRHDLTAEPHLPGFRVAVARLFA